VERIPLAMLVDQGLTQREIGERLGVAVSTVRHWLRVHGLRTQRQARRAEGPKARSGHPPRCVQTCPKHGPTEFWLEQRGIYRCLRCRSEAVSRRRKKVKAILVAEAGGRCVLCGYDRCIAALHFHHRDAATKKFGVSERGMTRALDVVRAEAAKCALVCSNCHAELEAGMVGLEDASYAGVQLVA
jgi:hypothetical protein